MKTRNHTEKLKLKPIPRWIMAASLCNINTLSMPPARSQSVLGRDAATEAIEHIKSRCNMNASSLKSFSLSKTSTAESIRRLRLSVTKTHEICDAGYGQGRAEGFVECVNYVGERRF